MIKLVAGVDGSNLEIAGGGVGTDLMALAMVFWCGPWG